jgi:RNA polymerase sigma-70 factor (ECF subfamily)
VRYAAGRDPISGKEPRFLRYSEESLAGRLLAGDPVVVGRVIRWIAAVLAMPRFWSLRDERDDLHQEVMIRVLQSLRRGLFDATRELQAYVQAVARNTALEVQRGRADHRLRTTVDDDLAARDPAPEDSVSRALLVRAILDALPEDCRRLIADYFFRERGYEEIAAATGWPVGTVKSRLARCLAGAARRLRRRFGTPGAPPPGRSPHVA